LASSFCAMIGRRARAFADVRCNPFAVFYFTATA
jgi:hypothetical protein